MDRGPASETQKLDRTAARQKLGSGLQEPQGAGRRDAGRAVGSPPPLPPRGWGGRPTGSRNTLSGHVHTCVCAHTCARPVASHHWRSKADTPSVPPGPGERQVDGHCRLWPPLSPEVIGPWKERSGHENRGFVFAVSGRGTQPASSFTVPTHWNGVLPLPFSQRPVSPSGHLPGPTPSPSRLSGPQGRAGSMLGLGPTHPILPGHLSSKESTL